MGVGFLAMLAGILEINPEMYEAGSLDGISNRFQEIIHITIPSMKPQMLFGAVMAIVATFQAGAIGVTLSGGNPTPLRDGLRRRGLGGAAVDGVVLLARGEPALRQRRLEVPDAAQTLFLVGRPAG